MDADLACLEETGCSLDGLHMAGGCALLDANARPPFMIAQGCSDALAGLATSGPQPQGFFLGDSGLAQQSFLADDATILAFESQWGTPVTADVRELGFAGMCYGTYHFNAAEPSAEALSSDSSASTALITTNLVSNLAHAPFGDARASLVCRSPDGWPVAACALSGAGLQKRALEGVRACGAAALSKRARSEPLLSPLPPYLAASGLATAAAASAAQLSAFAAIPAVDPAISPALSCAGGAPVPRTEAAPGPSEAAGVRSCAPCAATPAEQRRARRAAPPAGPTAGRLMPFSVIKANGGEMSVAQLNSRIAAFAAVRLTAARELAMRGIVVKAMPCGGR
ncbi:hypothetical protein WJX81_001119 [Elliptochloris bilobata]|uniref:Uncharacterized protein n=1 Tax=Elliptochloris bilobata TaxID=381761 RepID=A0AAW1RVE0_9CHLO